MKLLAIETTGAKASVALIDEGGNAAVQGSDETMNHLQHLIPMIQQLLTNCALSINDITGILVSEGPGSFTGIRIGMATAKGLAQALNVPIIGVPTLRSFAYHMEWENIVVCPVFDARRQQIYAGAYRWIAPQEEDNCGKETDDCGAEESGCGKGTGDCGETVQLVEDGAYDAEEFLSRLEAAILRDGAARTENVRDEDDPKDGMRMSAGSANPAANPASWVMFFGDGIERYQEVIDRWAEGVKDKGIAVEYAPLERRFQEALSVAKLGRKMFLEGKQKQFGQIEPVYLRQAEAQRKLEERLAREKM